MHFDVSFTIPANTAKATPHEEQVKLSYGVIHPVHIGFPSRCAGLAHIVIREGGHQVWPTNKGGSYNADGYTIPIDDYYELFREPYILTLVGWNLDDTFDHTLEVRFCVIPPSVLSSRSSGIVSVRTITEVLEL